MPILPLAVIGALYGASPAFAFGGLDGGPGGACTTFTTCTAAVYSQAYASTWYTFSTPVAPYQLPLGMSPGDNVYWDETIVETTASVRAAVGDCATIPCGSDNTFFSSASAQSQSDFGVNRARADTTVGVQGNDERGSGGSVHVDVLTTGGTRSVWRDVWTFGADGHFSAQIKLDGHSSTETTNHLFPSTFTYGTKNPLSEWYYNIKVWDVDHLTLNSDHELEPTLVASLQDPTGFDETRSSFASTLALDFNFISGVQYVVFAELGVNAHNGREIDLYNTARLTDVALSNGATLSALSGHDYVSSVPVPAAVWLFGSGLLGLIGIARHKRVVA